MEEKHYTAQDIRFGPSGRSIYGKLLLPKGVERPKLIVYAHEIGCTHATARPYGMHLANEGFAFLSCDFRGGGDNSKSEGDSADMSVMTEVRDLEDIFDEAASWDFVDGAQPVLFGASQGGLVAAIFAGRHPERVRAIIELYPGFNIPEASKYDFPPDDQIPERYFFRGWLWLGRRYVKDIRGYDSYSETMNYAGPVLIVQGTDDDIVPKEFVEKAAALYKNAEYHELPGAGHMFSGEYTEKTKELIDAFLRREGLLGGE